MYRKYIRLTSGLFRSNLAKSSTSPSFRLSSQLAVTKSCTNSKISGDWQVRSLIGPLPAPILAPCTPSRTADPRQTLVSPVRRAAQLLSNVLDLLFLHINEAKDISRRRPQLLTALQECRPTPTLPSLGRGQLGHQGVHQLVVENTPLSLPGSQKRPRRVARHCPRPRKEISAGLKTSTPSIGLFAFPENLFGVLPNRNDGMHARGQLGLWRRKRRRKLSVSAAFWLFGTEVGIHVGAPLQRSKTLET